VSRQCWQLAYVCLTDTSCLSPALWPKPVRLLKVVGCCVANIDREVDWGPFGDAVTPHYHVLLSLPAMTTKSGHSTCRIQKLYVRHVTTAADRAMTNALPTGHVPSCENHGSLVSEHMTCECTTHVYRPCVANGCSIAIRSCCNIYRVDMP